MARSRKHVPLNEILPGLHRLLHAFWPQIRRQAPLLLLSLAGLMVSIIARVLEPWPLKFIFDWIIMPPEDPARHAEGRFIATPGGYEPLTLLAILVVAMVLFATIRAVCDYLAAVGMAMSATRIIADIRARLFGHLQRLSLNFHHRAKSGDLVTRFTYDVERLRDTAVTAMLPLTANLLTITAMFGVMLWFNWQLALIPLLVLPLFYVSSIRTSKKIQHVVREHRRHDGALAAAAAEAIGAIKFVQALSLGALQEKAFSKQNKKSLKEGAKAQRLSAGLERKVDILLAIATAVVMWRGVVLVLNGAITPGTLILFITYMKFVFRPMRQVAKYLARISRATASGERIMEILDTAPEIRDRPGAIETPRIQGRISFEHVTFHYPSGEQALRDINLTIQPGERVALVGPSGGGKSTLLALLLRLYDPDDGRVLGDGRDLRDYRIDSIRRQFSMVLQDSVLFAVSIRDNILYGNLDADESAMEQAAHLANAHDFITTLPEGYATVVGERGATLSGGQLQRIAIARAVIRDAPVMILDEPTTGLDNINRQEVNQALMRSVSGRTTLLSSHDLSITKNFDHIVVIDGGRITESGTHDELMRLHGSYRRLYLQQSTAAPGSSDLILAHGQEPHALTR